MGKEARAALLCDAWTGTYARSRGESIHRHFQPNLKSIL